MTAKTLGCFRQDCVVTCVGLAEDKCVTHTFAVRLCKGCIFVQCKWLVVGAFVSAVATSIVLGACAVFAKVAKHSASTRYVVLFAHLGASRHDVVDVSTIFCWTNCVGTNDTKAVLVVRLYVCDGKRCFKIEVFGSSIYLCVVKVDTNFFVGNFTICSGDAIR